MANSIPEDGNSPAAPPAGAEQPTLIQRPEDSSASEARPPHARQVLTSELGVTVPPVLEVAVPLYRLGDYELLSEVGRGGMGIVFKARHVRLQRLVALKMILGGLLARPEDLQRFETEAAATAELQHPNIVALYEAGTHEGQPYLTMEYVSGSSLAQRVSLGVLPGRLAASYLERLARAVHYAHSRGVIHRDLKPANVLLDEQDEPKITDFGLAKVLQSNSGQTRTGAVIGTPSYMAPEQANASKDIGPACDIYSLGAILYELLTGIPPFRGESALATLTLVAAQEPVPPHLHNPGVDRDLETICLKCLEKDPGRRYATAWALADDLRRYLDGEPITARRLGTIGRAVKWCRRKPATAALLVVSLTALIAFAVIQWRTAGEERRLREEADQQRRQAEKAERDTELAAKVLRYLAYLARMRQAQQVWASADLDGTERLLRDWMPPPNQPDLRDWNWYYLKGLCEGRTALPGHTGRATAVAFSLDGKRLASAGGEPGRPGDIKVWDTATGRRLLTLGKGHTNLITAVAFSPDGKRLASASYDHTVRLWDAATGKELARFEGHQGHVAAVAFSPDGKRLASAGGDRIIRIWDTAGPPPQGGLLLLELRGHSGDVSSLAFSPDGLLLASAGLDETVRLWDPLKGEAIRTLRGHEGEVMSLAFSPAGKVLVSGGGPGIGRGQVKLWDVETGKPLRTHYGLSDRVLGVAVSRTGKIAAAGSDGLVRIWDAGLSSEAILFRSDSHLIYGITFSPEGDRLACADGDGRVRLWNSDGGQETLALAAPPQTETVAFSPDSKSIACCGRSPGRDGEVQVWELATGKLQRTLTGHAGQVLALSFGDGRLATGGEDHTVRIYQLADMAPPLVLGGHTGRVLAVACQPRGHLVASAGDDDSVRLWDARTGKVERVLTGDKTGAQGHRNSVLTLAFSPDGRYLASGSYDETVRIWDVRTGTSFLLKGHSGSVNAVTFSPDGRQLASGGRDRTIRIWGLAGRVEVLTLEGSSRPLGSLAYHPHGHRLASVGSDRSVRLWDLVTRQEILELSGPSGSLRSVAFSPDGRYLACGGHHTLLRVWEAALP